MAIRGPQASEQLPFVTHAQKVTRVVGFEAFLLPAEELAADLRRHFAASATVAPLPGATSKGHEIALQVRPQHQTSMPAHIMSVSRPQHGNEIEMERKCQCCVSQTFRLPALTH